jgi:2-amino-4-hydroxy-6-hydroxymethyldihydropteridine diphosphokinase
MKAVIALGSNLGDSEKLLQEAISKLHNLFTIVAVSDLVTTTPVGGPEQDDYLNAIAIIETDHDPLDLLRLLQGIESAAGRTREVRWGPRTLDLDLIVYGDQVINSEELEIPHPRAHERIFVLQPWLAVDPYGYIPGRGEIKALLDQMLLP